MGGHAAASHAAVGPSHRGAAASRGQPKPAASRGGPRRATRNVSLLPRGRMTPKP